MSSAFVFCCASWENHSSYGLLETLLLETASDPTGWGAQASKYAPSSNVYSKKQAGTCSVLIINDADDRWKMQNELWEKGAEPPCPLSCATLQTLLLSQLLRLNPWPFGVLIEASTWRRYNQRPVEVNSISTQTVRSPQPPDTCLQNTHGHQKISALALGGWGRMSMKFRSAWVTWRALARKECNIKDPRGFRMSVPEN